MGRAGIYRQQGFKDTSAEMEARAQAYEAEAFRLGGRLDKSSVQVLTDKKTHIESSLADAQKLTTEADAKAFMAKLNAQVDECTNSPISAPN